MVTSKMGLCGAHLLCCSFGTQLAPQLALLRSPGQRNLPQRALFIAREQIGHRRPRTRVRSTSVVCAVNPVEDGQKFERQSTVAGDSPRVQTLPITSTVVEHVVLFKVKDDSASDEVFKELRALKSLDEVDDLSASKVVQILGANYTHVLHSRHPNKAALRGYASHPSHRAVVRKLLRLVEDTLAIDWEAEPIGPPIIRGHGAARVALIKLVDGITEAQRAQVFEVLTCLRNSIPSIKQVSTGLNFSPARAKGFEVGFLALFDNFEDLKQLDGNSQLRAILRNSRVAPFLQESIIVDVDSQHS